MKLIHFDDVPLETVSIEGAKNVKLRWLISDKDNAPNFALRMFELEAGGFTPFHTHNWEHEVFVIQGTGILVTEDGEKDFQQWDVIYTDPNIYHQFKNSGDSMLRFLCAIPIDSYLKPQKQSTKNPLGDEPENNC
ncbi:MAG: cupin domain-containing protein [Candidatus Cloacimonetes bacterium]|nr:cupin domain-containing protein [Candidatus Cloacimonadota bacterium]MBL7108016.1 cupin domain-containing protein [Candidatus Cloacimonadota bacterium]